MNPREEAIVDQYRTPGHPSAFAASDAVSRNHRGLSKRRARQLLDHIDSYTLHREYKRPASYNPYYVYHKRSLIQGDIIDIRNLARFNDGHNYLLLLIDVFTRRIWVYPLRRKSAALVAHALDTFFTRDGGLREGEGDQIFSTDAGLEFVNREVQHILQRHGVKWQVAHGTSKACYAERAQKSLQVLIYKYLSDRETRRYINALPLLIQSYNARGHRSLRFLSPREAELPGNQALVRGIHMARTAQVKPKRVVYRLGQVVRIKISPTRVGGARRAYAQQFKGEYFVIRRINRLLPVPLYYLQSMNDEQHLENGFYMNEITPVRSQEFKVERVLRWRGRGEQREALVRWLHFDSRWDSWIPERSLHPLRGADS